MRALIAATALLAACALEVDYTGTNFACDETSDCPADFTCAANVCVQDTADIDPLSNCEDAASMDDDFDSAEVTADWVPYATQGASSGQDGDAFFILTGEVPASAGFTTSCDYDMTNTSVYVQVEDIAGGDATTYFEIITPTDDVAAFAQHGNVLSLRTKGSNSNRLESSTYDPTLDWWRIECVDDAIRFHAATDEGEWQLLSTHTMPPNFESARISIGVRNEDDDDEPVQARFDNYNGG